MLVLSCLETECLVLVTGFITLVLQDVSLVLDLIFVVEVVCFRAVPAVEGVVGVPVTFLSSIS